MSEVSHGRPIMTFSLPGRMPPHYSTKPDWPWDSPMLVTEASVTSSVTAGGVGDTVQNLELSAGAGHLNRVLPG